MKSTLRALAINRGEDGPAYGPGAREDPAEFGLPGVAGYGRGDKRIGVIWHTQGSGKSLLMAFYAGQLVRHPAMENPTIVVVTDRKELDSQLYETFTRSRLLAESPVKVTKRAQLRDELSNRATGGIYFTTLQKFNLTAQERESGADHPLLTDRRNLVLAVNTSDFPGNEIRMWYNPDLMENRQRAVFMAGCEVLDEKLVSFAYKE